MTEGVSLRGRPGLAMHISFSGQNTAYTIVRKRAKEMLEGLL